MSCVANKGDSRPGRTGTEVYDFCCILRSDRSFEYIVSEPRFLEKLPRDGVGFYGWEMLDEESVKIMAQSGGRRAEDKGQGADAEDRGQRTGGQSGFGGWGKGRAWVSMVRGQGSVDRKGKTRKGMVGWFFCGVVILTLKKRR